jgi:branched-chain amino acid transport system substrate-binding protein
MREKKAIIFLILFICTIVIYFSYYGYNAYIENNNIVIAAVSMSGERKDDGISMINGIELLLEEVNQSGGINGRKIILKVFDDFGNPTDAMNIANLISNDNKIQVVLGHFLSSCSLSAGRIYEKHGIPAITGSATSNNVTFNHKWYFSVIPDNNFQGSFIAYYINKILETDSISVMYDKDSYGQTLYDSLTETAKHIGLGINHSWGINAENLKLEAIGRELWNIKNNETIVMATHSPEAVELISYLKYPGSQFTIFGTDSFSTTSFLNLLKRFPQEKAIPGFYSDNIFAITPFIQELGSLKTINFIKSYKQKYKSEPTWVSATYYDAALTAVEAIRRSEVKGDKIRKSRHSIRDELAGIYNNNKAVKGVSGTIFFDKHGNVVKPLEVGYYKKGYFVPAFYQYQSKENIDKSKLPFMNALQGTFIPLRNIVIQQTNIVYTGVRLNKIVNINFNDSTYDLDFLIWFRFKEEFNETDIVFEDAVNPVKLGSPILEEEEENVTFRMYHVKATFTTTFTFDDFPFETHMINVRFHHKRLKNSNLIFIGDKIEYSKNDPPEDAMLNSKWNVYKTHYFQDLKRFKISSTKSIDHSQFNMNWYIQKKTNNVILKTVSPVILLLLLSYLISFLPHKRLSLRIIIRMLIFSAAFHYYLIIGPAFSLRYFTRLDYIFIILFAYVLISIGVSILYYYINISRRFLIIEKIVVPILICLFVIAALFIDLNTFFKMEKQKGLNKTQQESTEIKSKIYEWTFSVAENSKNDTLVGRIKMEGKPGTNYKYDIISGNDRQTFLLNAQTGEIHVANTKQLDFERLNKYHLKIEISDPSQKTTIGDVRIYIKDINEPPIFRPESFFIDENIPLSSVVISQLNAIDPDGDPITYAIKNGNEDGLFEINPDNGKITTVRAIDYETVPAYTLGIMAYDSSGLTAYQHIDIHVNRK